MCKSYPKITISQFSTYWRPWFKCYHVVVLSPEPDPIFRFHQKDSLARQHQPNSDHITAAVGVNCENRKSASQHSYHSATRSVGPTLLPLGHWECRSNTPTTRPWGVSVQHSYHSATRNVGPTLLPLGHGECRSNTRTTRQWGVSDQHSYH